MNFSGFAGLAMRLPELIGIIMIIKWSIQGTLKVMAIRARGESIMAAGWAWLKSNLSFGRKKFSDVSDAPVGQS